jgi:hypothetical protein
MTDSNARVPEIVALLPEADEPGTESRFTGPDRSVVEEVVAKTLARPQNLEQLVAMVRSASGAGEVDYRPGYLLHVVALEVCRPGREAERSRVAQAIAARVLDDATPAGAGQFLVSVLQTCGGDEVVPPLGKLLDHPELCEPATLALAAIGGAGAAAALRSALAGARKERLVSLAHALGHLRARSALAELRELAGHDTAEVRLAAIAALAALGDAESVATVRAAMEHATGWERVQARAAYLALTEALERGG